MRKATFNRSKYLLIIQQYLNKPEETQKLGIHSLSYNHLYTRVNSVLLCVHTYTQHKQTTYTHDIFTETTIHTCVVCYTRKWQQLFNRKLIEKNKN